MEVLAASYFWYLEQVVFPILPRNAQAEEAESKFSRNIVPVIEVSLQDTLNSLLAVCFARYLKLSFFLTSRTGDSVR